MVARRLEENQAHVERRRKQNELRYKMIQKEKDFRTLTFSPRILVSKDYKERSQKAFAQDQERALQQKKNFLDKKRYEKIKEERNAHKKPVMSDKSRKLLRDKSDTSMSNMGNRSASQNSFLARNYYNIKEKSQTRSNNGRVSPRSRVIDRSLTRDHSTTNNYTRDMSGSRLSYLNDSAAGKNRGPNGERLFSPKINKRSQMMSPRNTG